MQLVGPYHWPPAATSPSGAAFSNLTLDAADEIAAGVFVANIPAGASKTAVRVHFLTGTVTTGATVDVRLETVNTSGQPSGTLFGTNTNVSHVIANGDDNVWLRTAALTGSATITRGDKIAVVVVNPSSSFGNLVLPTAGVVYQAVRGMPSAFSPNRTTRVDQATPLACAIEFDDGTFMVPDGSYPMNAMATVSANTGTNPDELAMYWTEAAKRTVRGWHASLSAAAGADFRVSLYEGSSNTPVLTKDYDGDLFSTTLRFQEAPWDTDYTLTPGTVYRLGFLPLTANSIGMRYWECHSSYLALLDAVAGGQALHYSARNRSGTTDPDAAAWSQTTNRRLFAGVTVTHGDDGAGGGSSNAKSLVNPTLVS